VNGTDATGLLEREELATLEILINAAVAKEAGVGLIEGAAGIGKSRRPHADGPGRATGDGSAIQRGRLYTPTAGSSDQPLPGPHQR
jgi:hypothetical protein